MPGPSFVWRRTRALTVSLESTPPSGFPFCLLTRSYVLWYQFTPGGARHEPCLAIP